MTFNEFKNQIPVTLNKQQTEAAQTVDGPVLLLAVPGSGKTTVLVARLGYMIYGLGIKPENILTMTYTVAATNDMKLRFCSFFGDEYKHRLEFRTINSVCARIIKMFERASNKKVFDLLTNEKELTSIISTIFRGVMRDYPTESDIKGIRSLITYSKNMMLTDDEVKELDADTPHFSDIYQRYCKTLKRNKVMDFDDQMVYAYNILTKCPQILEAVQKKYVYMCVDEAQDTSKIQHKIIALIAQKSRNIFMVGDEDQSIYGFRAAYPEALANFEEEYTGAKVLLMEENFRSTGSIVNAADKFIQINKYRHQKKMITSRPHGSAINEIAVQERKFQYSQLLEVAKNCTTQTAVLYRDNENALPLIDLLERNNIDYKMKSSDLTFFTHRIVRDITNIINFAQNPYDTDLFIQIYYKLSTYLSKPVAVAACAISKTKHIPVFEAALQLENIRQSQLTACNAIVEQLNILTTDRADKAISRIVKDMGYGDYLERAKLSTSKIAILQALGESEPTPADLLNRLSELSQIISEKFSSNDSKLILSTIHSSKGLEYDNVYMLDVIDGIFPENVITYYNYADSASIKEYEEERRLFYVGATRAKDSLNIFSVAKQKSTFCDQLTGRFKAAAADTKTRPSLTRRPATKAASATATAALCKTFKAKQRITHKAFGNGTITSIKNDIATINFDNAGEKQLFLPMMISNKLICPLDED